MFILALVPISQTFPLNLPPLLPEASAQSSITINNVNSTSGTVSSSPYQITLSSFNAGTGSNRTLIVGVEANNQSVTSITFGSTSLTKAAESFHNQYTAFWYLKNPSGTANIVVTMAGATQVVVGAYELSGVDQTNPIPTTAARFGSGNPTVSLNTLYSGSIVLDLPSIYGGSTLSSPTCTSEWNHNIANKITGASSNKTQTTPGTVTCSWTASSGGDGWDDSAIEVKAAGTAPATTPVILNSKSTAAGNGLSSPYQITIYNFNPGSGSNGLLLVGIEANAQFVDSVKFGSTSLTKAVSSFNNNDAEFWYLKNPSSTPANLVVTMDGATSFVVGAYSFFGVDQTTPIPTTATNNNTASSSPTISITTAYPNSWVLDLPSIYGGVTLGSPTCSQQWNTQVSSTTITGASSDTITSSPSQQVTCSWTASSGDLWDDVAVEVKASTSKLSHIANTGILEPTYIYPTAGGAPWRSINNTKGNYTQVPVFIVANPASGPGTTQDSNYLNAINGQTKSGVVVLGYVWSNPGPNGFDPQTIQQVRNNIDTWVNLYPKIQGIFLDGMPNGVSGNEMYYQNITKYIHVNKTLSFSFANPGADQLESYNGTVDNLNIYENVGMPNQGNLAGTAYDPPLGSNHNKSWHEYYQKNKFSFITWNQTTTNGGLPSNATLGNDSSYVGFMYITDNPGCAPTVHPCNPNTMSINPYNTTSSYLVSIAKALNHNSTVLTLNAINSKGSYLKGLYVNVTQSNKWVPSGNTTLSYNATVGVRYTITMENSTICSFERWADTGSTNSSRSMLANSTNAAFTAVYQNRGANTCQ